MKAIFIALAIVGSAQAKWFIQDSIGVREYGRITSAGDTVFAFKDSCLGRDSTYTATTHFTYEIPGMKTPLIARISTDTTLLFTWNAWVRNEDSVMWHELNPFDQVPAYSYPFSQYDEWSADNPPQISFVNWNPFRTLTTNERHKNGEKISINLGGGTEYTTIVDSLGVVEVWTSIGQNWGWVDDGFHHPSGSYVKPNPKLNFNPKRERVILLHVVRGADTVYNVRKPITVALRSESSPWNVGQAWEWIDTQNTWDPQKVQAQWIGADGKSLPTQWIWQGNKIVLQVSPGAQPSWLRLSQPGKTRVWPLRPQF